MITLLRFCTQGFVLITYDRRRVLRKYASSWLWVDLVAAVPAAGLGGSVASLCTRALKVVKAVRIAWGALDSGGSGGGVMGTTWQHLSHRMVAHLEDHRMLLAVWELLRLLALALLVAHWMGCINFMVCRLYGHAGPPLPDGRYGDWVYPTDSWVAVTNLDSQPESAQYEWSMFKALCLMLTMGFANPPPMNSQCSVPGAGGGKAFLTRWCQVESWIALGCLAVGSFFYVLLIANITDTVATMHQARRHYNDKISTITDYMRSKALPALMRQKVISFYHERYADGEVFDEHSILQELKEGAPELLREVMMFNCRDIYNVVPLLRKAPPRFCERLAPALHPQIMFAGDPVFEQGEYGDAMFFILNGLVDLALETTTAGGEVHLLPLATIGDGSYFGDSGILFGPGRRSATARCKTNALIYRCDNDDMNSLLRDFPEVRKRFVEVAAKRQARTDGHLTQADGSSCSGSSDFADVLADAATAVEHVDRAMDHEEGGKEGAIIRRRTLTSSVSSRLLRRNNHNKVVAAAEREHEPSAEHPPPLGAAGRNETAHCSKLSDV